LENQQKVPIFLSICATLPHRDALSSDGCNGGASRLDVRVLRSNDTIFVGLLAARAAAVFCEISARDWVLCVRQRLAQPLCHLRSRSSDFWLMSASSGQ
jgi:hypothetical protein